MNRLFIKTSLLINRSRLYHKNVLDHYGNPRNIGSLNKGLKNIGTGLLGTPA